MKKHILIILLATIIIGCSSKDERYDDIDFMAYGYIRVNTNNPAFEQEYRLVSKYYALIDNHGNCQLVVFKLLPKPETKFYAIDIEKKLLDKTINDIIDSSANINSVIDLRPKHLYLYDGWDLIIRINKGEKSKTIHFREYENQSKVFQQLYLLIDSIQKSTYLMDTTALAQRRVNFMKYTMKSDSILSPLPPLPPRGQHGKFIPPKIVDITE
jgi:hypothetical protein